MIISIAGDHRQAILRVLPTINIFQNIVLQTKKYSPSPQGGNDQDNGHNIAGFFCMTVHLHISRWWSKSNFKITT
jgi:hypothetical protein